jgi:hypothetical protein
VLAPAIQAGIADKKWNCRPPGSGRARYWDEAVESNLEKPFAVSGERLVSEFRSMESAAQHNLSFPLFTNRLPLTNR